MIVLDASAAIELLFNTPTGREVTKRIGAPHVTVHAPHLIDLEVAQAVRRYVNSDVIQEERGRLALEHLQQLDILRYPHEPFLLASGTWLYQRGPELDQLVPLLAL